MRRLISFILIFTMMTTFCLDTLAATVALPKSLKKIAGSVFYGDDALDEVFVPYGAESIDELAFAYSGLKRITIPNTVTYIAENAFEGVDNLIIATPAGSAAQKYAEAEEQTTRGFVWEDNTGTDREDAYSVGMARVQTRLAALDEEEEEGSIILDDLDTAAITTEGIEDENLLIALNGINALNQMIEEGAAAYHQSLGNMAIATGELAQLVDLDADLSGEGGFVFSNRQNGSFSINGDLDALLGMDYEVLEEATVEDGVLFVQLKKGQSIYLLTITESGMTIGSAFGTSNTRDCKNQIDRSAKGAGNEEAGEDFFQNLINQIKQVSSCWTEITLHARTGYEGLISLRDDAVMELNRIWNEAAKMGLDDPRWIDGYEKASKNLGLLEKRINAMKPLISAINDVVNPLVSLQQIGGDLVKWRRLHALEQHMHPTAAESFVRPLPSVASTMRDRISSAKQGYVLDASFNVLDFINSVSGWIAKWSAKGGQAVIALPAAAVTVISRIAKKMGEKAIRRASLGVEAAEVVLQAQADCDYKEAFALDDQIHDAYGLLSGRVVDENGEPMDGVFVRLEKAPEERVETNSDGEYYFHLPSASWDLVFSKTGFHTQKNSFTIHAGIETSVPDVIMDRIFGKIAGVVTDEKGKPLEGVTVIAGDPDWNTEEMTFVFVTDTTDSAGRYTLEKVLPSASQVITFVCDKYRTEKRNVVVRENETTELSLSLEKLKGTLYGVVTDKVTQTPLDKVTIRYGDVTAETNGNGRYSITVPAEEPIVVTFNKDEYKPHPFDLNMDPGEQIEYDVQLTPRIGWLTGRVVEQEGTEKKPLNGAVVHCTSDTVGYTAVTAADGTYTIEGEDGSYIVEAELEDYSSYRYRATISGGVTTVQDDILMRAIDGKISGLVYDADTNEPIKGAVVWLGEHHVTTQTDGAYSFKVPSLSSYTLYAVMDGYETGNAHLSVPEGGEATYDFYLSRQTGAIGGKVTDESGNPISGVSVVCGEQSDVTKSNGIYTLENVLVGSRTVTFSLSGYTTQPLSCTVKANQTTQLNATLKKSEDDDNPGNFEIVTFGQYPQGANGEIAPIEWYVLSKSNGYALLLSRYGLDAQPYNTVWTDVTWETCTLRTWLNGTFMNTAFTSTEQGAIRTTLVDNSQSQGWAALPGFTDDYEVTTTGGNNTNDKVFLLSLAEAYRYLGGRNRETWWYVDNGMTTPTAYAKAKGAWTNSGDSTIYIDNCWWWLRSPGYYVQRNAAYVSDGGLHYDHVHFTDGAVRPALWVNLNSGIF